MRRGYSMMMFPKKKKIRLTGKAQQKLVDDVYKRDGHCCVVCGRWVEKGHKYHHEPPKSHGGQDIIEHAALLCDLCHFIRHNGPNSNEIKEAVESYLNKLYGVDRVWNYGNMA